MSRRKITVSDVIKEETMAIAKAKQRPGQSKEQTKLIARGIAEGIAEYKKQHKAKMRKASKAHKKTKKRASERKQTTSKKQSFLHELSFANLVLIGIALFTVGFILAKLI